MSSKEKNKKKEEKSIKDKKKKDEYVVIIDKDMLEKIENLKVEIVFINNSLLKDEKIINAMIYQYKILEYKCCNTKCSISNEWLSNPINLLLVRKNNKQEDLRINNLEYSCYNCYFQKNNDKNIFNKIKNNAILKCKICDYNINNMSELYKELNMCKLCLGKYKLKNNKTKRLDLFRNTFKNSLTIDDINNAYTNKTTYNNINSIDDIDTMSMLFNNNFMENSKNSELSMNDIDNINENTYEEIFNKVSNKKQKHKSNIKDKEDKYNETSKITIELDSMNLEIISKVKEIMEE